jgi:hypothetical protein
MKYNPPASLPPTLKNYLNNLNTFYEEPMEDFLKSFFEQPEVQQYINEGDYKHLFGRWETFSLINRIKVHPSVLCNFLYYIIEDNPYEDWSFEDIEFIFGKFYSKQFN